MQKLKMCKVTLVNAKEKELSCNFLTNEDTDLSEIVKYLPLAVPAWSNSVQAEESDITRVDNAKEDMMKIAEKYRSEYAYFHLKYNPQEETFEYILDKETEAPQMVGACLHVWIPRNEKSEKNILEYPDRVIMYCRKVHDKLAEVSAA